MAELIKPDIAEKTKIQRSPWLEADVMEFENVYKPLKISRQMGLPTDNGTDIVYDYKELFSEEGPGEREGKRPKRTRKKVFIRGGPGMGKSTMVSKMVYDWATDAWKTFILVIFISLKLVRPGEPIENIIVDEDINPVLYAEDYDPAMIRSILINHGEKCLIIFDGLDELRHNDEIIQIVQDKKYRSCNILLTTRPHSEGLYLNHFFTLGTISGFTEEEALNHIKDMLKDKEKANMVFQFTKENQSVGFYEMWQCPMLLLFICILVNDGDLDLTNKHLTMDEIYERLHLCLYKKYTIRRNIDFDGNQWNQTMIKLGKMARRGLERGELLYKTSDIEKEVGKEAFHFGIIVGYKDRRIIRDLSADFWVCFLHRSIQEFLAAKFMHNELNCSDRIPEDLWPEVWDSSTINLMPLLFVFIVEMAKENSLAMEKLLTSWKKICNTTLVCFYGTLIGRRVMQFIIKALSTCNSVKFLQFSSTRLQDDHLIPQLVHVMGPMFEGLNFVKCIFVKGIMGSIEPFTRDKAIKFVCDQSSIPANSLSFLIAECRCITGLHIGAYHISGSNDRDEVNFYFDSLISLFSRRLPSLKCLYFEAEKNNTSPFVPLHNSVIQGLMKGHNFTGNMPDLQLLYLMYDGMPFSLMQIILETIKGRTRAILNTLNISSVITNNNVEHCLFITSLFRGPFPNLQFFTWNDASQEDVEDNRKEKEEMVKTYHEEMMAKFYENEPLFNMMLPQHSLKGYLPNVVQVDLSLNRYMPRRATEILMEALDGSRTLRDFKLNTILLPQFMTILQGNGLPNLEKFEIRHWFTTDQGPVPQERQEHVCLLPKLREFDLKWLVGKEQLHPNLLKQLMISVRGSMFLVRIDISGQNIGGNMRFLLHKDGLPALEEFKADSCNLNQADLVWIGVGAQAGKLNKVKRLSLSHNPLIVTHLKHLCKNWESLQEINLAGVLMDSDDVYHLMKACRERMPHLQVVNCDSYCKSYWEEHKEEKARKMLRVEYVSEYVKQLADVSDAKSAIPTDAIKC